jgi:hypothetical protein
MGRDDMKFLAALVATLVLMAGLVYSSYRRDLRPLAGTTVDLKRIERLMDEGGVSRREASWWEEVKEGEP